jgi:hypothetical protein
VLAVTAALAVLLLPALGGFVGHLVDGVEARTAADAAALASVRGGRPAALALATANGAELVAWARQGDEVIVTVRVGEATAVARAAGGEGAAIEP